MGRTGRPTIYVHCGFHKTGSTALQAALRASAAALRQRGILIPYAGTTATPAKPEPDPAGAGHHNIAWQLLRSRRFDPTRGDLSDLSTEINAFTGDVILSSEFFESLLAQPETVRRLRHLAHNTGRDIVFILYLRNQIAYCESLYFEMLKHGEGLDYQSYTETILQTGLYRHGESINHFHYDKIIDSLQTGWPDQKIILRNYQTLGDGGIVADFSTLMGLQNALKAAPGQETINQRYSVAKSLYWFYRNRCGMRPTPLERARIQHVGRQETRPATSSPTQERFIAAFAAGNHRLCNENTLPHQGLTEATMRLPATTITLEQMFSFETQCAVATGQTPAAQPYTTPTQCPWLRGIETAAATIPATQLLLYRLQHAQRTSRRYTDNLVNRLFDTSTSSLS